MSKCSASRCQRMKKEATSHCSSSLYWLREIDLVPYCVKAFNLETNQKKELLLDVSEEVGLKDEDLVSIALMAKDRHMN